MKLKQQLLLVITTFLIFMSVNSQAGRQGINFYYGLGLGVIAPPNIDVSASGDVMLGIEEDGWALEGIAFIGNEVGTDNTSVDTSASGTHIGLAYRTIERNNNWFKIKVSATSMDFDDTDSSDNVKTNGVSYTLGWGIRMSREARLEIDYSYYDSSDIPDPVHMATLRYFWGGAEYNGRGF